MLLANNGGLKPFVYGFHSLEARLHSKGVLFWLYGTLQDGVNLISEPARLYMRFDYYDPPYLTLCPNGHFGWTGLTVNFAKRSHVMDHLRGFLGEINGRHHTRHVLRTTAQSAS